MALNGGPQGQHYLRSGHSLPQQLVGTTLTTTGTSVNQFSPFQFTAPNFPDLNSYTSEVACLASGHAMGEEVEFADGSFVVFCERCGTRLVLKSIPGGVSLQRCRLLLMGLAAGEAITEDTLGSFLELRKLLEDDLEALELATVILEQAAEIVKVKGVLDTDA